MRIDFNAIPETAFSNLNGGTGDITAKIAASDQGRIIPCRIHPGGSIGLHRHETGSELCYVLYGSGVARCDGKDEPLSTDVCHICPKGNEHSITNTGFADLVLLAVEIEQP